MNAETREKIQARIREIDEWLQTLEVCEMTEGGLSSAPDIAEVAELHQEREQLLEELAKAA